MLRRLPPAAGEFPRGRRNRVAAGARPGLGHAEHLTRNRDSDCCAAVDAVFAATEIATVRGPLPLLAPGDGDRLRRRWTQSTRTPSLRRPPRWSAPPPTGSAVARRRHPVAAARLGVACVTVSVLAGDVDHAGSRRAGRVPAAPVAHGAVAAATGTGRDCQPGGVARRLHAQPATAVTATLPVRRRGALRWSARSNMRTRRRW